MNNWNGSKNNKTQRNLEHVYRVCISTFCTKVRVTCAENSPTTARHCRNYAMLCALLWAVVMAVKCCTDHLYTKTSSSLLFLACNSRLRSAIRRHHPPQRAVLSQICCFGECKVVMFQILWDGAEPRDSRTTLLSSPVAGGEANRILLASALSSMHIICPNRVSRRDWIIAVSLGCFVSLHTSSFRTNWYHLMPSSIRRHHWSSASILHASIYRNIGKIHVLYSFNFVEMASCDLQIWFSKLCMAARVMALRRLMSQVLPVDEWIREPK